MPKQIQLKSENEVLYPNPFWPVGSIFMSVSSTNPANYFGGTWSLWGSGRVPVCVNTSDSDFNSSEKTGGSKTVTLTTSQMPSHTHTIYQGMSDGRTSVKFGGHYSSTGGSNIYNTSVRGTTNDETTNIVKALSTGGGSSHTNLQPYITCYMWKRTA
jgi:microcystin-dependent protein